MSSQLVNQAVAQLSQPVLDAVAAGALYGLAYGVKWLKAHTKNANVQRVLSKVNDAVSTHVLATEQTIVDQVRQAAAGGKLGADTAKQALATARDAIKAHLGAQGIAEAQQVLEVDDFEKYLTARIEATVATMKGKSAV